MTSTAHDFRLLVKKNLAELLIKTPRLHSHLARIIAIEQAVTVIMAAHLTSDVDPHPEYLSPNEIGEAIAQAIAALTPDNFPNFPASKITSGTFADSLIPASIARDTEVSNAIAAHLAADDPHSQYSTAAELAQAIAAITAASIGAAPASHTHTLASIGAAPTNHNHTAAAITDLNAAIDARLATIGPLDSDLVAIAALSTQAFGRSLLTLADTTAARQTLLGFEQLVGATKPTTRANGTALQAGDRWWSTTDNMEFFWNSTLSVWMSRSLPAAGPGVGVALLPVKSSGLNIYLEEFSFAGRTGLINNTAANIQVQLERCSTTADVVLATLNTGQVAANTRFYLNAPLNLLLNVSALNLTCLRSTTNVILNGSTLTTPITQITYRWVKP